MTELVEEMRARLTEVADSEQVLVRALGEALSRVDQQLLQSVRKITADHEARRGALLQELHGLASRIGAFPIARQPATGIEYTEPARAPIAHASADSRGGGDWREAANNIQHELDLYVRGTSSH